MNCKKVQNYLPELRAGRLSRRHTITLNKHLEKCEACQRWVETWDQVCNLSLEVCHAQEQLNWESFYQVLDAELQNHPMPGRKSSIWDDARDFLPKDLLMFPKKSHLRTLLVGAAAVFIMIMSSHFHIFHHTTPQMGNLTIGNFVLSEQHGAYINYQEVTSGRVYYHEEINIEMIDGKDQNP